MSECLQCGKMNLEVKRLSGLVEVYRKSALECQAEVRRLGSQNAEMLEALKNLLWEPGSHKCGLPKELEDRCFSAIVKAEGKA